MKLLTGLFLVIFGTSSFASNYQQPPVEPSPKIFTIFTKIDKANALVTQVKTLVSYNSALNVMQQFSVIITLPFEPIIPKSTNSSSQLGLDKRLDNKDKSPEAYLRALPREQLYPLNDQKNNEATVLTQRQLEAAGHLSWQTQSSISAQTSDDNNLLLSPGFFTKNPRQVMF